MKRQPFPQLDALKRLAAEYVAWTFTPNELAEYPDGIEIGIKCGDTETGGVSVTVTIVDREDGWTGENGGRAFIASCAPADPQRPIPAPATCLASAIGPTIPLT